MVYILMQLLQVVTNKFYRKGRNVVRAQIASCKVPTIVSVKT